METATGLYNGHDAEISGSWEAQDNLYIYNTAPVSVAQETSQQRGWRDFKSQNTRNPGGQLSLLEWL